MFENWIRTVGRRAVVAVVFVPTMLSVSVSAADGEDEARAKASFCKEVADCTAYFTWSETHAAKLNHPEEAAQYGESKDWSFGMLMMMRSKPSDLQLNKADVSQSLQRLAAMADTEGEERLPNLYQEVCSELIKYPERRMKYWAEKKD